MLDTQSINALRLLQSADGFRAKLAGEFSAIHGISVNEFFLLMHLERAPLNRLSRAELAKRMHLSASTVTRMAAPMEKLGFVSRQTDDRDARLTFVVLTDAGALRVQEARATFDKKAQDLFGDRWIEEDLEALAALLNRLVAGTASNLT
ncbi:MAG: MarR family winged helix-turn-helix transcriptional regulator [Rhodospirillaceae bacterium]